MQKLLVAVMLLSLQASANTKILVEKADQQYVVVPDCAVSEDVTQVSLRWLRVGAPIYVKQEGRQVRCTIEDYYQVRS
jgi:hypothetical protein